MFKSFFNWKVTVNILIAMSVFAGLVWGTFKGLEVYTNHGKEVPVPNVVNMQIEHAVRILENMGLIVDIDSFKYDPKYKPLQVLQTYPIAGSRVKERRSIILKVNPKTWAKVEVPDVLDKYKGLAYSRLELVGLKIGDTIYEPNIQKDAVIRMEYNGGELKPGALLPKFSVIDLVIGSGPMRNISVPNVVGLTVREAKEMIKTYHFEVGFVDSADGEGEDAIVYYQDPDGKSHRDQGMQIDLWASKKIPAKMLNKIKELDKIYRKYEMIDEDFGYTVDGVKPVSMKDVVPKMEKVNENVLPVKEKKLSISVEEKVPNGTTTKPREYKEEKSRTNKIIVE